jgi:hypothetical protein
MKAASILLIVTLLAGCSTTHPADDSQRYVHVVILWLKHSGNADERQQLIDMSQSFVGKIPGLVSVSCGPVLPSTRPVVDSSYDVGLVMVFQSERALQDYPRHPLHQRALKEVLAPLVDHYIVYDFPESKIAKGRP